jgi:hypothetical protein
VHTDRASALLAFPPCSLILDEIPYPHLRDILKVVDHTHAILGAISLVEIPETLAWILVTSIRAELDSPVLKNVALSYYAFSTMARRTLPHLPATRASVVFSEIAQTYAAIHSARCDQVVLHSSSSTDSLLMPVGLPEKTLG